MTISPPPITGRWIVRQAKLFEAGDYPDKGIQVTQEQLHALAAAFDRPVPVLIEHADSPLELGYLTAVRAEGDELFGDVSLSPEADALVRSSGADKLSLALSPELDAIREVSLVRHPRVESARLFSGALLEDWRGKYEALETQATLDSLVREGKLTPAQAPIAGRLLAASPRFSQQAVRGLVLELLELQPDRRFHELAPAASGEPNHLEPEQAEFYRKHFPGLPLDLIETPKRG